jgi:hypothetical protein
LILYNAGLHVNGQRLQMILGKRVFVVM